ncbi:hypothetical protein CKAH01_02661 [Colletotrichum kahawae]|uniref:Uncharacterized protein n=1 Tax=Colletotrichum kahawae TaxID=34407 RepID=A0AAD9XYL2_COLKA|nr:hypothetical protein CKAH01_02661 [Colletotrichum kahawae]
MIQRIHELAANWVQGWISNIFCGSILIAIPLGPITGSITTWWQSSYGGFVRLFALLQRLGMIIGDLGPFADMLGVWFFDWIGGLIPTNSLSSTIWRFFMGGHFF